MKSLVVVMVVAQCENRLTKKHVVRRSRSAKNRPCFKGLENRGNPSDSSSPPGRRDSRLKNFSQPLSAPRITYCALPLMASLMPGSATSAIIILLISILVTFTMQPFNLLQQMVLLLGASTYAADLTAWEQIHQVIHTYPLAIDGKNYDLFEKV